MQLFPKNSFGWAATAIALALSGATAAQAQTFTFVGALPGSQVVTISADGGASYVDAYAGRYQGRLNGGPATNIFCVDISHEIQNGDTYAANTNYKITDSAGSLSGQYYGGGLSSALTTGDLASVTLTEASARTGEVAWLADNYLNANSFSGASGSTNLADNLTAINLSIWDIVRDGGDGLSAGQVMAQKASAYTGLVSYYEGQASGQTGYTSGTATWIQAPQTSAGSHLQDYVYEPSGPMAVPEPGVPTMLLCLGVVAGGAILRRRRQAAGRA